MRKAAKGIAVWLVIAMAVGMGQYVTAEQFTLNEYFDNYPTDSLPTEIDFKGAPNSRIVKDGAGNKALYLHTGGKNTVMAAIGNVGKVFTVAFELKYTGAVVPGQIALKTGKTSFVPVSINETGGLLTPEGRRIADIHTGKYYRLEIIFNTNINRYAVRLDGKEVLSYWKYNAAGSFSDITLSFRRYAGKEDARIYLDNLCAHTGSGYTAPERRIYNTAAVEFEESVAVDAVGDKVYYTQDFDLKGVEGKLGAIVNANKLYTCEDKKNGGSFLAIEKASSESAYFDIKPAIGGAKHIVFEADFCMSKKGMIVNLFRLRDSSSLWNDLVFIGVGGELNLGATGSTDKIYQLKTGEWVNLAVAVNLESYTYDVYLNGMPIAQEVEFVNQDFGDFAYTRVYVRENTAQGILNMDNLKIYEGIQQRTALASTQGQTQYNIENTVFTDADKDYIDDILGYNGFARPTPAQLRERFEAKGKNGVHPRIMATEETFKGIQKNYRAGNQRIITMVDNLQSQADKYMKEPLVEYKIGASGNILDCARKLSKIIPSCAMLYKLTDKEIYAQRVWQEIENLKTYPDWDPTHFLDTAEICAAVGIGYDWCYEYLSEEQRKTCEDLIVNCGLAAGRDYYEGMPPGNAASIWTKRHMNWSMVCNGGLAVGAMAIADTRPDEAFYTISAALRSIEYGLAAFAPGGGWEEGPGYWAYSVQYLAYMMGSMENTFGDDFGVKESPGLSQTALAFLSMDGNTGNNNYHDDAGDGKGTSPYLFFFGNYYDNKEITAARLFGIRKYKVITDWKDLLWYDTTVTTDSIELPLDTYVENTEAAAMRSSWEDFDGVYLGFHAGRTKINDSNHGHHDTGTFVLDNLGERWAIDLGPDSYNLSKYMGNPEYYRVSAQGHNTIVVDPSETAYMHDIDAFCKITDGESKDKGGYKIIDMTSLFKSKNKVDSAKRGFMLTDDRNTVIIRDELKLNEKGEIYWLMHTQADVNIINDGKAAVLELNGKKMRVDLLSNISCAKFEKGAAVPIEGTANPSGQNPNAGITKLYVRLKSSGAVNISVRITPNDSQYAKCPFECGDMDSWTIEDGERLPAPQAEMLYINGSAIEDFNPKHTHYTVMLPYNYDSEPVVTVDAAVSEIKTTAAETVVKVTDAENADNSRTYYINYQKLSPPMTINGVQACPVYSVSASDEPETPAAYAVDGDVNTKWAASGYAWLLMDFGSNVPINTVALSFMKGSERKYKFAIEVSEDGKKFRRIYDGETSGTTNELESFGFDTMNARYLRFVGFGNSYNDWNSLNEIAVLKQ